MMKISMLLLATAIVAAPAHADPATLKSLATQVDAAVAGSAEVPSIVVAIRAPARPIDWSHASGARAFNEAPAQPGDEFRIASITKTFVAVAALRLAEDGKLDIDSSIAPLIASDVAKSLVGGGYDPAKITVRHLLTHRSGIRNYADTDAYAEAVGSNPIKQWSVLDQVALAMQQGAPIALPGASGDYSDTNYVILGQIIERRTSKPLGAAVAGLVGFAKLGLKRTYWEVAVAGELAEVPDDRLHAYQDGSDTASLNPSFDLNGGGGLVSTTGDLIRFYQGLFAGRVFRKPATLKAMLAVPSGPGSLAGENYALGIARLSSTGPVECWGHPGHWSALAAWCPKAGVGFAVSLNGAGEDADKRQQRVLEAVSATLVKLSSPLSKRPRR